MKFAGLLALVCVLAALPLDARKKKKKDEDFTQTRELPKESPAVVTAETRRLVFRTTPLSAKGLLSQQVRDGLKEMMRADGGGTIVKIRAFVAGSADLRRVRDLISETFAERRLPLPAVSVILTGGLPLEGAQVVMESIAVAKKVVNPTGLAFISGQGASSRNPLDPVLPLAEKSVKDLQTAVAAVGAQTTDVLRVGCFLTSLAQAPAVRTLLAGTFRQAALTIVQTQRAPTRALAECEAVARPGRAAASPLEFVTPEGMTRSPNFSQIALVSAPRVALSGTQIAFGVQPGDAALAFQRLQRELEQAGANIRETAFSSLYPLSDSIAELVRNTRFNFYDKTRPPASTMLPFEGLPSTDSSFAVDVVAISKR